MPIKSQKFRGKFAGVNRRSKGHSGLHHAIHLIPAIGMLIQS